MNEKPSFFVPHLADTASVQSLSSPPSSDGEYADIACQGVNWEGHVASSITFEGAVFIGAKLARTMMRSIKLRDVSIRNCDLANADWTGAAAIRSDLLATRLTGFNGSEANYRNILFRDCMREIRHLSPLCF